MKVLMVLLAALVQLAASDRESIERMMVCTNMRYDVTHMLNKVFDEVYFKVHDFFVAYFLPGDVCVDKAIANYVEANQKVGLLNNCPESPSDSFSDCKRKNVLALDCLLKKAKSHAKNIRKTLDDMSKCSPQMAHEVQSQRSALEFDQSVTDEIEKLQRRFGEEPSRM